MSTTRHRERHVRKMQVMFTLADDVVPSRQKVKAYRRLSPDNGRRYQYGNEPDQYFLATV